MNLKYVVSESGLTSTLKRIDTVEFIKSFDDEAIEEDLNKLATEINLTEDQLKQILNSNKIKELFGSFINKILISSFDDSKIDLTKDKIENFLNIAIDEYNKVSNTKISETERQKIINSIDDETITNINEELSSINFQEAVEPEYVKYIKLVENTLFGNYTLIILAVIIVIIGLIALFRFSLYKWMPYVKTSTIINGCLMLIIGILLLFIPLEDMEMFLLFKNVFVINIFITSLILFIISIILHIAKKQIIKNIDNKM